MHLKFCLLKPINHILKSSPLPFYYHEIFTRNFPVEKLDFWLIIDKIVTSNDPNFMQNSDLQTFSNTHEVHTSTASLPLGRHASSDQKLLYLCHKYGNQARFWKQKFAGLLPEVNRRKLYEQKGFGSIFEFAARLAGMSEEQVRRVLNLEKKFESTPLLKNMLINGEASVNKLARIASIVTPDNEEILANQVKLLSKNALETLVKDEKQNGSSVPGHNSENPEKELQLSSEVKQQLLELQEKGLDLNQLLQEFLNRRKEELEQAKEDAAKELINRQAESLCKDQNQPSRYISMKIKKLITQEFGTKCSMPTCQKLSENIHHTQRFSLAHTHDPRYLAPMCKEHHLIAHSIDVKFQEKRSFI